MSWPAATMLLLATLSLGCGDALPSPAKSYPAGPYRIAMGATVPDLAFEGIDAAGTVGTVKLADFYTPRSKRLVGHYRHRRVVVWQLPLAAAKP